MATFENPTDDEDEVVGSEASDVFRTGSLTHYEFGISDNDEWRGLGGDDTFYVGIGNDTFIGGEGSDTLDFGLLNSGSYAVSSKPDGALDGVLSYLVTKGSEIDLLAGTYSVTFARKDGTDDSFLTFSGQVESIERVYGTIGNDIAYGSDADEYFSPGAGVDLVDGRAGFDSLDMGTAAIPEGSTPGGIVAIYDSATSGTIADGFGSADEFRRIEQIYGTGYADRFEADAGNQIWSGYGRGADVFRGGRGFDQVYLGSFFAGTTGVFADLSSMTGTYGDGSAIILEGIEALVGSSKSDRLFGDRFANEFDGGSGDDEIDGRGENDSIYGGQGNDTIYGGGGNDSLNGSQGNDSIVGGAGLDLLHYGGGGVIVSLIDGKAENDGYGTVDTIEGIENVNGSSSSDMITGDTANNIINGRSGDDTLVGGGGDDLFFGAEGADEVDGGAGKDVMDYSQETGELGVNVTLKDGSALDTYGNEEHLIGIEVVFGTARRDLIKGGNKADTLYGGDDKDSLGGLDGNDTLYGGAGNDSLGGGKDKDELYGDAGDDVIFAGEQDDVVYGGDDKDTIWGEEGTDTLFGGEGNDEIKDESAPANVVEIVNTWIEKAVVQKPVNKLNGDGGNDTLLGTAVFSGGKGNDVIRGAGILNGDDGNDELDVSEEASGGLGYGILIGGLGNDKLIGTDGLTIADYRYSKIGVDFDLTKGTTNAGSGDRDTLVNIRDIIGSYRDDTITAGNNVEQIRADKGNDTFNVNGAGKGGFSEVYLIAGQGNDVVSAKSMDNLNLSGGSGKDKIFVSANEGVIDGNEENDDISVEGLSQSDDNKPQFEISGGSGNDTLRFSGLGDIKVSGGSGSDTFILSGTKQSTFSVDTGNGDDTVALKGDLGFISLTSFTPKMDTLDISAINDQNSDTFAEVKKNARQSDDTVIFDIGDARIFLEGVEISELTAGMFIL